MSDQTNLENDFEKLQKNICEGDELNNAFSIAQQQIYGAMQIMNETLASVKQDTTREVINIGNYIFDLDSYVDFTPMLKDLSEAMTPLKYINLLIRLKWPLFLIGDDVLQKDILTACATRDDEDAVKKIVFTYCSDDFLKEIEDNWNSCEAISIERKPILSEAILMHKQGYYYASTSIIMCQLYGIVSDIVDLSKKNGLELDKEEKVDVSNYFEIDQEKLDKEKYRWIQMVAMTDSGPILWTVIVKYLLSEILCSSESKERWATQPLRNKICHGAQLNFGTKEHSLKAILSIDILIQLAYEIEDIIEIQRNNEATKGICTDEQQED